MKITANPFYFGNEVYDDDFCNRVQELQELKKDSASGQNILLYAPRRFGKTSLLKKLKQDLDKDKEYKVIFVDLFSVSSLEEFIQTYFNLIVSSFDSDSSKVMEILNTLLHIRPNITMSIKTTGDISYGLSMSSKEQKQTLEEVLNLPSVYAKKFNKKVVVIFDEFQEIEQLELEKKLRSTIQTHSREIAYLFSGSKKSILGQMFNDKSRAFYKAVKHFHIDKILLGDWSKFIVDKFNKSSKTIDIKHIQHVYKITQGYPYYMQQIMSVVWDKTLDDVTTEIVESSLKLIVEREYDLYSLIWTQLTPNQKNSLKYIVKCDGLNLYSNENLKSSNLATTTLKSTLEALLKKDICDKKDNRYYIIDPFMQYWMEQLV